MPVLDVAAEVGNSRVEDVAKRILSKEEVAQYAGTFGILVLNP